jgi:hypothetical protein
LGVGKVEWRGTDRKAAGAGSSSPLRGSRFLLSRLHEQGEHAEGDRDPACWGLILASLLG